MIVGFEIKVNNVIHAPRLGFLVKCCMNIVNMLTSSMAKTAAIT